MLKPSGLLCYSISVPGGSGTVVKDLLVDDDDSGNHFNVDTLSGDANLVTSSMARWFNAEGVTASGDRSLAYVSGFSVSTGSDGRITQFTVTVQNDSNAAGDIVGGHLYILLPQVGNYGA